MRQSAKALAADSGARLESRPAGTAHPLLALPNAINTPHIGGATHETLAVPGIAAGPVLACCELRRTRPPGPAMRRTPASGWR
ncbi:MAG TPA: hypothetical protein VED20_08800 [Streptosporangiaceae bacterium]|nr:hypothetical protein [Streptosporangiaceae bacterium]